MSTSTFQTPRHALVLALISLTMCLLCALSVGAAELFMPDNVHGRQGVITFYRWFGLGFIAWYGTGIWALTAYKSMRNTTT